jgi:predicted nucleic acid-binding protein
MAQLFWDASALIKRYFVEQGSDTVDALFAAIPHQEMCTCPWGYTETYSLLVRRLNEKILNAATFTTAVTALQAEIVTDPDFGILPISENVIFGSTGIIRKHNLNATDAAILTMLLAYLQQAGTPQCVLVASDKRMLRAASAEGLSTLNPQEIAVADIPVLLASL